jgi:hypothetical protein
MHGAANKYEPQLAVIRLQDQAERNERRKRELSLHPGLREALAKFYENIAGLRARSESAR